QGYEGTDRQCRGRLLAVLRDSGGPVPAARLDAAWPDENQRTRSLASLVADGLAEPLTGGRYALPRRPQRTTTGPGRFRPLPPAADSNWPGPVSAATPQRTATGPGRFRPLPRNGRRLARAGFPVRASDDRQALVLLPLVLLTLGGAALHPSAALHLGQGLIRHRLGLRHALERELGLLALAFDIDDDDLAGPHLAEQDLLGQHVLDRSLDGPAQRPGAEHRVVTALGEQGLGGRPQFQAHVPVLE